MRRLLRSTPTYEYTIGVQAGHISDGLLRHVPASSTTLGVRHVRQTVPADRGGQRAFTRATATGACAADARGRGAMSESPTHGPRQMIIGSIPASSLSGRY